MGPPFRWVTVFPSIDGAHGSRVAAPETEPAAAGPGESPLGSGACPRAGTRCSRYAKAKELIEKTEANCLISNSMKAHVTLVPTIR